MKTESPTSNNSVSAQRGFVSTATPHLAIITPELAKEMLSKNTSNRPVSEAHVKRLASELTNGKWQFNGDSIRFADGVLLDGQHRLEACIRSGVSFQTFVINGLDRNVFTTIDSGRSRTASDTLAVRGEKNAPKLAATVRFVDMCITGRATSKAKFTNTEIEEVLAKHPGVRESVEFCSREKKSVIPITVLAACHYLFRQKDAALADKVVDQLTSGVGLTQDNPIYKVRERVINSRHKLPAPYLAAILIKGFNQLRTGTRTNVISWRGEGPAAEPFPVAA